MTPRIEELELACAAYRDFIINEIHWECFRDERNIDAESASKSNAAKLNQWLKDGGVFTAGDKYAARLAAANEAVKALEPILKIYGAMMVAIGANPNTSETLGRAKAALAAHKEASDAK